MVEQIEKQKIYEVVMVGAPNSTERRVVFKDLVTGTGASLTEMNDVDYFLVATMEIEFPNESRKRTLAFFDYIPS